MARIRQIRRPGRHGPDPPRPTSGSVARRRVRCLAFRRRPAKPWLQRVVAVGGGAQSALLLQTVSDVTGLEQELPAQTVGASYGDAALAGLATGTVPCQGLRTMRIQTFSIVAGSEMANSRDLRSAGLKR